MIVSRDDTKMYAAEVYFTEIATHRVWRSALGRKINRKYLISVRLCFDR